MDEHGLPIVGAGVDYTKVLVGETELGACWNEICV